MAGRNHEQETGALREPTTPLREFLLFLHQLLISGRLIIDLINSVIMRPEASSCTATFKHDFDIDRYLAVR